MATIDSENFALTNSCKQDYFEGPFVILFWNCCERKEDRVTAMSRILCFS